MPDEPKQNPIDMDAKLEAEIEAALGGMSVEDMLDYADKPREARAERERKTGTVVNVHGGDVFIEFGPKSQGICPLASRSLGEPDGTVELMNHFIASLRESG